MAVNLPSGRYLTRTVNGFNVAAGQVYTAMGWFYAAWADGNWHNVFFFGPNSSIHDNVEVDTTGKTIVSVDFSAGVTGSTLTSNTWHHWAVVRSSNTNWSLYLDGVLDCTETVDISGRGNNASAMIGNWAGAGDDLVGRVQDVKIWQAALTAEEIKREMKQSPPARWTNLLHWSPMRDQTVSRAEEDRSGRDGSWTEAGSGTVTIADGAPVPYRFAAPRVTVPVSSGASIAGTMQATSDGAFVGQVQIGGTGQATSTGTLVLQVQAAGTGQATADGALAVQEQIAGTMQATAGGDVAKDVQVAGTMQATSDGAAVLTLPLAATMQATADGSLAAQEQIAGVGQATADGTIAEQVQISGTMQATADGTLNTGATAISGTMQATADGSLGLAVQLAGTMSATTNGTYVAQLVLGSVMSATSSGTLALEVYISGTMQSTSFGVIGETGPSNFPIHLEASYIGPIALEARYGPTALDALYQPTSTVS